MCMAANLFNFAEKDKGFVYDGFLGREGQGRDEGRGQRLRRLAAHRMIQTSADAP